MAAVLGGCQSLHTNGRDEALSLPSEASALLALRTQQIIANESGVTDVIDPFGGAWALEKLTDELEEKANEMIAHVDRMGGMVAAIADGWPQREIEDAAWTAQRAMETKESVIVGVNEFVSDAHVPFELQATDPSLEPTQNERVASLRKKRDADAWRRALDEVRATAKTSENLMPKLVSAVQANATVGEVADVLRDVFGEYRPG